MTGYLHMREFAPEIVTRTNFAPESRYHNPYHSSSCKPGSWELVIPPGTQKRLLYWSSDFKYRCSGFHYLGVTLSSLLFLSQQLQVLPRNDADIVAVRRGCKFTGWTGVSYDGEKIVVDAWQEDFWVVFAR